MLSSEDESLLIWRDTFLILDLGLDVFDGICWLNIKSDGFTSEGLDEDLHTTSKSEDQMESGLLLDVVVGEGSSILKLLTSEDESLLIGGNTFLVLNFGPVKYNKITVISWFLEIKKRGMGLLRRKEPKILLT